jgi:hypothetical protein
MSECKIKETVYLDSNSPTYLRKIKTDGVAGWKDKRGYYRIFIGRTFLVHRVVAYLSGKLSYEQLINTFYVVDHLDGNIANNSPNNLRVCPQRENCQNRSIHRNGRKVGAYFDNKLGRWRGRICINGKDLHLGCFDSEEEAHNAYLKALGDLA